MRTLRDSVAKVTRPKKAQKKKGRCTKLENFVQQPLSLCQSAPSTAYAVPLPRSGGGG